jgi:hypothetical protein
MAAPEARPHASERKAAKEWAHENKIDNFGADDLFDPKTNLEAGARHLHRAFEHWETQSDPMPFALAEYNAGASRAQRWAVETVPTSCRRRRFSEYRFSWDAKICRLNHRPV